MYVWIYVSCWRWLPAVEVPPTEREHDVYGRVSILAMYITQFTGIEGRTTTSNPQHFLCAPHTPHLWNRRASSLPRRMTTPLLLWKRALPSPPPLAARAYPASCAEGATLLCTYFGSMCSALQKTFSSDQAGQSEISSSPQEAGARNLKVVSTIESVRETAGSVPWSIGGGSAGYMCIYRIYVDCTLCEPPTGAIGYVPAGEAEALLRSLQLSRHSRYNWNQGRWRYTARTQKLSTESSRGTKQTLCER